MYDTSKGQPTNPVLASITSTVPPLTSLITPHTPSPWGLCDACDPLPPEFCLAHTFPRYKSLPQMSPSTDTCPDFRVETLSNWG